MIDIWCFTISKVQNIFWYLKFPAIEFCSLQLLNFSEKQNIKKPYGIDWRKCRHNFKQLNYYENKTFFNDRFFCFDTIG